MMRVWKHAIGWGLAIMAAVTVAGTGIAQAAEYKVGTIMVSEPWARASASPMAKAGAAYATLVNAGQQMDRLLAAESPVAGKVELHTVLMEGGVMKMRQVNAIEIHPGEPTVLQPGGLHVMLMGLHAPLKEGEVLTVTLTFEKAGKITVEAPIRAAGAKGSMGGMSGGHKGHGAMH